MYLDLPPLGVQRPQQQEISDRPVEAVCRGFFLQYLVVRLINVISTFFGISREKPLGQPIQERSTEVLDPVTNLSEPALAVPDTTGQQRQVKDNLSDSEVVVTKAKDKPVTQPPHSTPRQRKQPTKPEMSHARQQRQKKTRRKQRRQEQRRQQCLERQDTQELVKASGVKNSKMLRQERRLAERRQQQEIRDLMAIEIWTDAEVAQKLFDDEYTRLAAMNVKDNIVSAGRTGEERRERADAYQRQVARGIRIPNNDLLLAQGTPQDKYQERVAELYQRLKNESYGQWNPLVSREEFQVCFAPLVSGDEELDVDEITEAFINFRKLQEIQSLTDIEFAPQAFAILFEDGCLDDDPQAFDDVIRYAADLEPGFGTIEQNNDHHRNQHYIRLVEGYNEAFGELLAESTQRLERHMQFIKDNEKDELQDSGLESLNEPASLEQEDDIVINMRLGKVAMTLKSLKPDNRDLNDPDDLMELY